MTTRFQIGGNIFKAEDLESVKLVDTFVFTEQVYRYKNTPRDQGGEPDFPLVTWTDLEAAMGEMEGMSQEDAARHPRANLLMAATLWLTMRNAGHPMDFKQVVELDMAKDIVWLPDTDDRANPTKRNPKSKGSAADVAGPKPDDK